MELLVTTKGQDGVSIKLDRENVEQVTEFKYLESKINAQGGMELEINNGITNATKLFYALNDVFIGEEEGSEPGHQN